MQRCCGTLVCALALCGLSAPHAVAAQVLTPERVLASPDLSGHPGLRHRAGWTPDIKLHRTLTTLDFFRRHLASQ